MRKGEETSAKWYGRLRSRLDVIGVELPIKEKRKYDNSKRAERARMRALRRALKEEARVLRRRKPKTGKPRLQRYHEQREKLLPVNRVCPKCSKIRLRSAQWVIVKNVAQCRSCWKKVSAGNL